jgi:hydrogenase-4 component E
MINYLSVMFAITIVYLAVTDRFVVYARLLGLQGFILFGITLAELHRASIGDLLFISSETFLFKGLVVPYMINVIVKNTKVEKVTNEALSGFYELLLIIISLLISIFMAYTLKNPYIDTVFLTIAFFTMFAGLIIIVTHRLIISHLIGFLVLENAAFLFSIAVGSEMPMMINIGTLLDIFVGVLILGFFGMKIKPNIDQLTQLKD